MKIKLEPWITPIYVMEKRDSNKSWHIKEIDAETLSEQCDKFREEIFAKAGKKDPLKSVKEN